MSTSRFIETMGRHLLLLPVQAVFGLAIAAGDASAGDRPPQPHGRWEQASNSADPPPVRSSPLPPKETEGIVRTVDDREIRKSELDEALRAMMRSAGTPGLSIAVLNQAEVVYRRAFGLQDVRSAKKVDEQTVFEAASLSKPLFAYFVMKHVDRGLIELDRPLYLYRPHPDLEHDERHQRITARMVLSHTSGLPNWREGQLEILFPPGTQQSYSGEGYQYLAGVLAHVRCVDDVGLGRLFQLEVAQPLGAAPLNYIWNESIARHKAAGHSQGEPTQQGPRVGDLVFSTAYTGPRPGPRVFGAAYSLHTTAGAYAQFLAAMIKEEGLSQVSFTDMLQRQVLPAPDAEGHPSPTDMSLGFRIDRTPFGAAYYHTGHNGDFRAYCCFYRRNGFGLVIMTNCDDIKPLRTQLGRLLLGEPS